MEGVKIKAPRRSPAGMPAALREQFALLGEHSLRALDALPKSVLERGVLLAFGNVLRDRSTDDFRDRLVVDSRHSLELLGLLC